MSSTILSSLEHAIATHDGEPVQVVLQSAHDRIVELEAAVKPKKKRQRESAAAAPAAKRAAAAEAVVSASQLKMLKKKMVAGIKSGMKGVKFHAGYDSTVRSIKHADFMTSAEFQSVFGAHGTLLQPTASNKPKSTVTIKSLSPADALAAMGLDAGHQFKGELWTKGGQPSRGGGGYGSMFGSFGGRGGGGFSKGKKIKGGTAVVFSGNVEVKFSANSGKLNLKMPMEPPSATMGGGDDGMW